MIRSLYLDFGFFTALAICLILFMLFIFWLAGIAGIIASPDNKEKETRILPVLLCVLVPVYPIIWLISDMIKEYLTIRRHSLSAKRNRVHSSE
jgi:O-antigen/teichoic acid export membrane protein